MWPREIYVLSDVEKCQNFQKFSCCFAICEIDMDVEVDQEQQTKWAKFQRKSSLLSVMNSLRMRPLLLIERELNFLVGLFAGRLRGFGQSSQTAELFLL